MNRRKLEAAIVENGYTKKEVAEKLHITPKTFYKKIKKGVFGTDEVQTMISMLNIKDPISIFLSE